MKEIAALICTRNKAAYLRKSLASLVGQTLSHKRFEVIVIDNGSTDNTREVADEFRDALPVRYVYEPLVGLSQARNKGWQNTLCEFVAYLDDDAVASPQWLERILDRFRSLDPPPASLGGRIVPMWERQPPEWLTEELKRHLSIVDWSDKAFFLTEHGFYLAGCNVAYRRQVLEETTGFSVHLGRRGNTLLSNEDLLMQNALYLHGHGIFYDPAISVQHHVSAERLTKKWFYKRFYWQGGSDAILEYHLCRLRRIDWHHRYFFMRSLRLFLEAMREWLKAEATRSSERVARRCHTLHRAGQLWFDAVVVPGPFGLP
jgi:glycosyltransferase involved in cell wall biosynthesis